MECRFCRKKSPKNNIFEMNLKILNIIEEMLKINKEDEFPKLICNTCVTKVESIEKFLRQCEESDAYFRNNTSVSIKHEAEVFTSQWDDLIETNTDTAVQLAQVEILYTVCKEEAPIQTNTKGGSDLECSNSEDHVETNHYIQENNTFNQTTSHKTTYSCSHCPAKYTNRFLYNSHIAIHDKNIQYVCHFCPIVFGGRSTRNAHIRRDHSNEASNISIKVGESFEDSELVNTEQEDNVAEERLDVAEDNRVEDITEEREGTESVLYHETEALRTNFMKKDGVAEDLKNDIVTDSKRSDIDDSTTELTAILHCSLCPAMYGSKRLFDSHVKIHDSDEVHICKVCQIAFRLRRSRDRHMTTCHREEADKERMEKKLARSLKKNTYDRMDVPLSCKVCGYSSASWKTYSIHMRTHSPNVFQCDTCSRTFSSRTHITDHIARKHATVFPYLCELCPKKFATKCTLRVHVRGIHLREKKELVSCHICNRKLHPNSLKKHLIRHTGESDFRCEICDKPCGDRTELKNHGAMHTDERPHTCSICSGSFKTKDSLKGHQKLHTGKTPFKCPICLKGFSQHCFVRSHFKNHHKESNYEQERKRFKMLQKQQLEQGNSHSTDIRRYRPNEASNINIKTGDSFKFSELVKKQIIEREDNVLTERLDVAQDNIVEDLKNDIVTVSKTSDIDNSKRREPIAIYHCSLCPAKYEYKHFFDSHVKMHDSDEVHICKVCQIAFSLKRSRDKHMTTCHKEEADKERMVKKLARSLKKNKRDRGGVPYLCTICGRSSANSSTHSNHMLTHNPNRKVYQCDTCSRTFSSKVHVAVHIARKHSTEFPYLCESCPKKFPTKYTLRVHVRGIHLREKKELVSCHICDRKLNPGSLKRHLICHTGESNFRCEICEKPFGNRKQLIRHSTVHTDNRPHTCTICSRSFKTEEYLKEHERLHTGETPVKCPVCLKGFSQHCYVRSHFRNHHKELNYKQERERYEMLQKQLSN